MMDIRRPAPARPVWVIGGANLDFAGRSAAALKAGDSNPGRVHASPGGVARNVAENLARLGHLVRLASVLGDDRAGRWLHDATRRAGVDMRACRLEAGVATASYLSLHGPDGKLVGAVNDMAALERLTPQRLAARAPELRRAAAIVIDANLADTTLAWLFTQGFKAPLFADAVSGAKCRRLRPWLDRLALLKANAIEAQALSGLPLRTPRQAERIAAWFHEQGVGRVAISQGESGLLLSEGPVRCWQMAWPVPVLNVTGAGDALMAALVHGALAGWPLARCADFAAGCAALTLSVAETNHPALSEAAVRALRRRTIRE